MLKETLKWIETMAERREVDDETRETAEVLARRQLDNYSLPKRLARESLDAAME